MIMGKKPEEITKTYESRFLFQWRNQRIEKSVVQTSLHIGESHNKSQ